MTPGVDPLRPTHFVDLSGERIVPYDASNPTAELHVLRSAPVRISRPTGNYWFEFEGHRTVCISLKDLLAGRLRAVERARPGTLEKLSHTQPRSRRIVARDPKQLFDNAHLVRDFAEKLAEGGWWYGTNNSANETNAWLEKARSCAGLKWGTEFKTSMTAVNDAIFEELTKGL